MHFSKLPIGTPIAKQPSGALLTTAKVFAAFTFAASICFLMASRRGRKIASND